LAEQCYRRVLNPGFLASYWSAGFGRFLQESAISSHWLADCANFTPTPRKITNTEPLLLVQKKQQTNPLLSMNIYIPLMIIRNYKNKQLTLFSQRKLAL
jgi:hypothetical protein